MKQITKTNLIIGALVTLSFFSVKAQTELTRKTSDGQTGPAVVSKDNGMPVSMAAEEINTAGKAAALTSCTDKINYVGNTLSGTFKVGGSNGFNGLYQVFPTYKGTVIGVEFVAEKFSGTNPTMSVQILNSNSAGYPGNTVAGPAEAVVISGVGPQTYTVMFPSPIPVGSSGFGFSVAFYNYVNKNDSVRLYRGPNVSFTEYSFLTVPQASTYTSVYGYFNFDVDFMIRPIVSTSVNPNWVSAKTSTGCGIPATYTFVNNGVTDPIYDGDPVINPLGSTRVLDFGDSSPTVSFPISPAPVTHSYNTLGNYIANYTQTYIGWTDNCVASLTTAISVDNPQPAFIYNSSGLTVMFTNTSQNMSTYSWNFGDLSTSNQINPSHTFSSPGTYVVELEGTAPCGKVKYTLSITVSATTGIDKSTLSQANISLFPNPAGNLLNVAYNAGNKLDSKIEIYSTLGAALKVSETDFASGNTAIDISDLPKGMYFMKVRTAEGDIIKSFVKE